MALEKCAGAGAGTNAEADRRTEASSHPGASSRQTSIDRSLNGDSCGAISTATASSGKPQLPQKPKTAAAPLGFRARLEGQIAGAKGATIRKTPQPSSTVTSRQELVKAQPQALQLNRRMVRACRLQGDVEDTSKYSTDSFWLLDPQQTIDEMKEWYKSTVRPEKEKRERAIPIPGFTRLRRLGKGGFGEVWDVHDESSRRCYALKHIASAYSASVISEIRVGISLFPRVRLEADTSTLQLVTPVAKHKSIIDTQRQHEIDQLLDTLLVHQANHGASSSAPFTELFRVFQENRDFWLLYERGGRTLHELMFGIHGEFHKGSRVYRLEHRALYQQMRADPAIVKSLVKQLLEAVNILSKHQVVHADIKPDNILLQSRVLPSTTISQTVNTKDFQQVPRAAGLCVQLIDFGSAFTTERNRYPPATQSSSKNGGEGTPEYVPPEALVPSVPPPPPSLRPQSSSSLKSTSTTTIDSSESLSSIRSKGSHSSSFDVWSVGAVFLELLCGFPLWFGYRSHIELHGKEYWVKNGGLFATKHRDPASIQQRQLQVVGDIDRSLQSFPVGMVHGWPKQTTASALDLLRQLLDPSPKTRVIPEAALAHPFLRS